MLFFLPRKGEVYAEIQKCEKTERTEIIKNVTPILHRDFLCSEIGFSLVRIRVYSGSGWGGEEDVIDSCILGL